MQINLSGLAKALNCSRQYANKLSRMDGFPYLQKPGLNGATRWLVDVGQVRRWLEGRDLARHEEQQCAEEMSRREMEYRVFWKECLRRGYRPDEISAIRDSCSVDQLRRKACRMGFSIEQ